MPLQKINAVIEKLIGVQISTDDKSHCTPEILKAVAEFFNTGLPEVISDLEEIRDQIEESEVQAG